MSTELKAEILELGETFVTLLKSPICPPEVRASIISHLDQVRLQLDMTNPELVRSVFSFLAATTKLPASEAKTQAQGQAISAVLAAAAPTTAELPTAPVIVPAQPEPQIAMAAASGQIAQPAQQVAQPVAPEPARTTGRNLASRLAEEA